VDPGLRLLKIIGIGAGDPDYITVQAVAALQQVDVFFFVDKGDDKGELRELRRAICRRYVEHDRYRIVEIADPERARAAPYDEGVRAWHQERVVRWQTALTSELAEGQCGAFLAWGDPALYDSTLRILEDVRSGGDSGGGLEFALEVIPGISAVQALAARHQIPLNRIGNSVLVTTGRRLVEEWGKDGRDVVVMLDAHCTFLELTERNTTIYWGAYLGTPDEILISGTIGDCGEEIARVRAQARAQKGWVFDTYLLRPAD
jgi:precorrin-6A synthase